MGWPPGCAVLATCLIRVGLGHKLVKLTCLAQRIMSYCVGMPPPDVAKDGADVTCSHHRISSSGCSFGKQDLASTSSQHLQGTRMAPQTRKGLRKAAALAQPLSIILGVLYHSSERACAELPRLQPG